MGIRAKVLIDIYRECGITDAMSDNIQRMDFSAFVHRYSDTCFISSHPRREPLRVPPADVQSPVSDCGGRRAGHLRVSGPLYRPDGGLQGPMCGRLLQHTVPLRGQREVCWDGLRRPVGLFISRLIAFC